MEEKNKSKLLPQCCWWHLQGMALVFSCDHKEVGCTLGDRHFHLDMRTSSWGLDPQMTNIFMLSITRVSFLYVLIVIEKKFLWRSIKLRLKLPICFPYSIKHGIFSLNFASWRYCTVAKMKDGHKPISQKWQDDPGMARLISENVWKFKAVSTKESSPLRLQWLLQ